MIITLTTGTIYKIDLADDRRRLMNYIPTLRRRGKVDELDIIAEQIEAEAIIGYADLEIYRKAKNTRIATVEFTTGYYKPSTTEKFHSNNRYSYINGQFYRLPIAEDNDSVVYALLDKYIYERQRNERNSDVCLNLRRAINKFIPDAIHKSDAELKSILTAHETNSGTYYGDCLSDDSDSEAEEVFKRLPKEKRTKKLNRAKTLHERAKASSYQGAMDGKSKSPKIDFKTRPVIHRSRDFARRQANADLASLNKKLVSDGSLTPEFLDTLETKFVVAQYRGVHYITSKWDATARREHRKMDELNQPQYSSAVFASCGITSYHQYLEQLRTDQDFSEQLRTAASRIAALLLLMQHSDPVSWDGFTYASLFHLLQYWYSSDYNSLPKRIATDLAKADSVFSRFLVNADRPLLSTADIPYHALKYAYGIKLYEEYKDQRLRPRWRKNGRAERPYSGKVYISLHPLNDYTEFNPSHVTSMFKQGLLKLISLISSERETSFLGFLPEDRVVFQHIAKYPSFKGDYKTMYEDKYGISKSMYEKLQNGFQNFPPHSEERKNLKLVLGEYLCAFQEVRMIQKAQRKAEKRGEVLIYRDEDGKFSLYLPETPHTANKRLNPIVMAKRELYKALAPNQLKRITFLTQKQVTAGLNRTLPAKEKTQRETEWMRFFTTKRTFAENETITPVITLTR